MAPHQHDTRADPTSIATYPDYPYSNLWNDSLSDELQQGLDNTLTINTLGDTIPSQPEDAFFGFNQTVIPIKPEIVSPVPFPFDDTDSTGSVRPWQTSTMADGSYIVPAYSNLDESPFDDAGVAAASNQNSHSTGLAVIQPVTLEDRRKRIRGKGQDEISACWNSPLCPKQGEYADPSTCDGGCSPWLDLEDYFSHSPSSDTARQNQANETDLTNRIDFYNIPTPITPVATSVSARRGSSGSTRRPAFKRNDSIDSTSSVNSIRRTKRKGGNDNDDSPANVKPADLTITKPIKATRRTASKTASTAVISEEASPEDDGEPTKTTTRKKLHHNEIERRYRKGLNAQIEALRDIVPTFQQSVRFRESGDVEDVAGASKPSKALILATATEYIRQIQEENTRLSEQNKTLRSRVQALPSAGGNCKDCSLLQYVVNMKLGPT